MDDQQYFWVSEFNQQPEILGESHFPKNLKFYDTTLRDGEQTIGVSLDKEEKLQIAKMLDELGVDRIEAGMPVVSNEDKQAVELILNAGLKAEIWGFCRAVRGDIDACLDVGVKSIICEISTSPYKMQAYNFTPEKSDGKGFGLRPVCKKQRALYRIFCRGCHPGGYGFPRKNLYQDCFRSRGG